MPLTLQEVLAKLDLDEPDYEEAAKLGPDALPHLEKLVAQDDPRLASKAAYLASLIPGAQAAAIVSQAAQSQKVDIRLAAAAAIQNLPADVASGVAMTLLADGDAGVRKVAIQGSATLKLPAVRARLEELGSTDPEPWVQQLAKEAATAMPV